MEKKKPSGTGETEGAPTGLGETKGENCDSRRISDVILII